MKYLIANWKASITRPLMLEWLDSFFKEYDTNHLDQTLKDKQIQLILCPPYPLIPLVRQECKEHESIKIGSQHVSPEEKGPFTGEVTAELLKEYVEYAIVGHSERRTYFHLDEASIEKIIRQCSIHEIHPILCIRNTQDTLHPASIVAYEPVEAIGSGHNASVEDVIKLKKTLGISSNTAFLYGGSVDENNISEYLDSGEVDGFLVGTASLDPHIFYVMAQKMSSF